METVSMVAAFVLPLWNIPLIANMQKQRSSRDVSLWWAIGVWVSFLLMLPAGLTTTDQVFKVFSVMNMVLFTGVLVQVVRFRKPSPSG